MRAEPVGSKRRFLAFDEAVAAALVGEVLIFLAGTAIRSPVAARSHWKHSGPAWRHTRRTSIRSRC